MSAGVIRGNDEGVCKGGGEEQLQARTENILKFHLIDLCVLLILINNYMFEWVKVYKVDIRDHTYTNEQG